MYILYIPGQELHVMIKKCKPKINRKLNRKCIFYIFRGQRLHAETTKCKPNASVNIRMPQHTVQYYT